MELGGWGEGELGELGGAGLQRASGASHGERSELRWRSQLRCTRQAKRASCEISPAWGSGSSGGLAWAACMGCLSCLLLLLLLLLLSAAAALLCCLGSAVLG